MGIKGDSRNTHIPLARVADRAALPLDQHRACTKSHTQQSKIMVCFDLRKSSRQQPAQTETGSGTTEPFRWDSQRRKKSALNGSNCHQCGSKQREQQ
jgi:hypothetical protein